MRARVASEIQPGPIQEFRMYCAVSHERRQCIIQKTGSAQLYLDGLCAEFLKSARNTYNVANFATPRLGEILPMRNGLWLGAETYNGVNVFTAHILFWYIEYCAPTFIVYFSKPLAQHPAGATVFGHHACAFILHCGGRNR